LSVDGAEMEPRTRVACAPRLLQPSQPFGCSPHPCRARPKFEIDTTCSLGQHAQRRPETAPLAARPAQTRSRAQAPAPHLGAT
jgi:hypothetical protein